jgi:hypothetical protein
MAQKNMQQDAEEAARRLDEETALVRALVISERPIPNALESW